MNILGFGHYAPDHKLTNEELTIDSEFDSDWIVRRTGILERRYAAKDQAVSDLAAKAIQDAMQDGKLLPSDIGSLFLATSTPDYLMPPTSPKVASMLGLEGIRAFDIGGGCSGFINALYLASAEVQKKQKAAVVCGANVMSRRVLKSDIKTASLFGDAAGAIVIGPHADGSDSLLADNLVSLGSFADLIKVEKGGSRNPLNTGDRIDSSFFLTFDSSAKAFQVAIKSMVETSKAALVEANMSIGDIDWWIPHQANIRIISSVGKMLGIAEEKTAMTIQHFGNTSAASIPFTLSYYQQKNKIKKGHNVLMSAAGSGFLAGSLIVRV